MNTTRLGGAVALIVGAALALSACGGSDDSSSGFSDADPSELEGTEIKVLMPYKVPEEMLARFTDETGIEVQYNTGAWDGVAQRLVVAHQAGTYIADVTEFDWSFTGQFGGNGWYEPLQDVLDQASLDDLGSTKASFVSDGNLYAACYTNDFRISMYNSALFKQAGLDGFPETFDDLDQALDTLKARASRTRRMTMPMAATEGSVTPWYLLTLAMGGELFDESGAPVFNEPGWGRRQGAAVAGRRAQQRLGHARLGDHGRRALARAVPGGAAAVNIAAGPGNLAEANDPKVSSIVGDAEAALVPGETGPGGSFGLQEGFGIPTTAENKDGGA